MACGRSNGNGCESCVSSSSSSPRPLGLALGMATKKKCMKCKEEEAKLLANQTEALCPACLRHSLLSKFKTAINNNELIHPKDKILLAFSGGPSSRVALEFLLEIRDKAQRDATNCKDGSLSVFGFGVAFVDESLVLSVEEVDSLKAKEEIKSIIMNASPKLDEYLIEPLENVYSNEDAAMSSEGDLKGSLDICKARRLQSLVDSVDDFTGKEDLVEHLRLQLLQKLAKEHGYTKLVLGLCTSRLAVKVITSTAKGQGYSLPGDLQYYDGRWDVPVILPLRDCVAKELVLYCHWNRLRTVFIRTFSTLSPAKSINSLATSFISVLQEENPSRERTIVRTGEKLKPFSFNHPTINKSSLGSVRRQQNAMVLSDDRFTGDKASEFLCPLCSAPLDESEVMEFQRTMGHYVDANNSEDLRATGAQSPTLTWLSMNNLSCNSCRFQILGSDNAMPVHSFLPQSIKDKALTSLDSRRHLMRSEICEYLIPEDSSDHEG